MYASVAICHETLIPDGALAQVSSDQETSESAGQRVDVLLRGAQETLQELSSMIGSRLWNQTTPEEQTTVNATIESIEKVLEDAIKGDFQTSQESIANSVKDLVSKTNIALEMKKKADSEDTTLISCRADEKALLIETMERLSKVKAIREEKEDVCRRKEETRNLTWALETAPSGLCDFSDVTTEGICLPFASLQDEVASKDAVIEANQTLFRELMVKCNQLMDDLDNIIRETTINNVPGNTAYTTKRLQCDREMRQSQVAMCSFGDRLQEKCQSKADADALVVQAYHQQEDRVAQWNASQLIKCKLMRFRHGERLDALNVSLIPVPIANCTEDVFVNKNGELRGGCVHADMTLDEAPCEFTIDFQRDVGIMDYQLAAIDSQMTKDNFDCAEKQFTFSGQRWSTGAEPIDYVKSDYSPDVTLNPLGTHPFEFCGDADAAPAA
jgi:hypothetical protein